MHSYEKLEELTTKWATDRQILANGKIITQAMKLGEEFGELCSNIAKGKDIKDDIGDMIVVLNNIAKMSGTDLKTCWNEAYDDIKDRKGILTKDGVFVKSTDSNYKQLVMEFEEPREPTIVDILSDYFVPDNTVKFIVLLDNGNSKLFGIRLFAARLVNIKEAFIGKPLHQFKTYLKTIGDLSDEL